MLKKFSWKRPLREIKCSRFPLTPLERLCYGSITVVSVDSVDSVDVVDAVDAVDAPLSVESVESVESVDAAP
jgi:predicted nuclease with RNAse H fold